LKYRALGKTEIKVSEIGFGAWQMGGPPFWESQGEKESLNAVSAAVDAGINLFDTAPVYGFGRSETLLGKGLKKCREKVVIATKCGLLWKKEELGFLYNDLKPASIRMELETSLRRLQTDWIDIYQIHFPSPDDPIEPAMETIARFMDEGKIRAIGVSNFEADLLKRANEVARVDSVQTKYNMLEREAEKEILPTAEKCGMGVLAYSPLASGLLTGKYSSSSKFSDWRGRGKLGIFRKEQLKKAYEKLQTLMETSSSTGIPLKDTAINWVLENPAVTSALVGMRKADHVYDNLKCLES
jgi:aryl-alcohol dehydrogenase-like predicted oxidoreductase